ncbi:collagen alpha-1(I) chain-like [Neovison vison]|uniref:collagen alpha-1(I) chain-like n=1 Tax=Neovison vison TaxID=452646 RepID=UPI001CF0B829|nr:collagen alpha-1(I) chain-like [Neogale vison]
MGQNTGADWFLTALSVLVPSGKRPNAGLEEEESLMSAGAMSESAEGDRGHLALWDTEIKRSTASPPAERSRELQPAPPRGGPDFPAAAARAKQPLSDPSLGPPRGGRGRQGEREPAGRPSATATAAERPRRASSLPARARGSGSGRPAPTPRGTGRGAAPAHSPPGALPNLRRPAGRGSGTSAEGAGRRGRSRPRVRAPELNPETDCGAPGPAAAAGATESGRLASFGHGAGNDRGGAPRPGGRAPQAARDTSGNPGSAPRLFVPRDPAGGLAPVRLRAAPTPPGPRGTFAHLRLTPPAGPCPESRDPSGALRPARPCRPRGSAQGSAFLQVLEPDAHGGGRGPPVAFPRAGSGKPSVERGGHKRVQKRACARGTPGKAQRPPAERRADEEVRHAPLRAVAAGGEHMRRDSETVA